MFFSQSGKDSVCRVSLLPRRIPVFFQNLVDDLFQRSQPGLLFFKALSFGRNGTGDRLPHHPAMHSVLLRQSFDRLSGRIPAPDLFE